MIAYALWGLVIASGAIGAAEYLYEGWCALRSPQSLWKSKQKALERCTQPPFDYEEGVSNNGK